MKPNIKCSICNKPIYRIPSRINNHNVCSYSCRNKLYSGINSFCWKGEDKEEKRKRIRINDKLRRIRYKKRAVLYLGGKCSICGYDKCIAALECHHLDPTQKDTSIKDIISGSWSRIVKELDKCCLLCSNCHREHHYNLNNKQNE